MAENTLALDQIVNLLTEDNELKPLFSEYEAELRESDHLRAANEQIRSQLNLVSLDHMLVSEAFATMNKQKEEQNQTNEIIETCYAQVLKMEHLLQNKKFENIFKYTMLLKQNEAQATLGSLKRQNKTELDNMAILESRHIVLEMRQVQRDLKRSQQELNISKQLTKESQDRRRMSLDWASGQLNRKIINLLLQRKELIELKQELAYCGERTLQEKPQKQQQQPLAQSFPISDTSLNKHVDNTLIQSALDFLKNFPSGNKSSKSNAAESSNELSALRSILMVDTNKNTRNQAKQGETKQVRFAPSPLTESEDESMAATDNWGDLVERMDVNLGDADDQLATDESVTVMSSSFTESSPGIMTVSNSTNTTSGDATAKGNNFGQSSTEIVNIDETILSTACETFGQGAKFALSSNAIVTASELIPTTSRDASARSIRFGQSFTSVSGMFAPPTVGIVTATEQIPTTSLDAFTFESKLYTEKQFAFNSPSSKSSAMSEDQDQDALLFSKSNDDFFLNFTDDPNGQTGNVDYEL